MQGLQLFNFVPTSFSETAFPQFQLIENALVWLCTFVLETILLHFSSVRAISLPE